VAHILDDPPQFQCEACGQPLPRFTAPPSAPSGWECVRCHRVWNPSVLACHHCPAPEQPAGTWASFAAVLPPGARVLQPEPPQASARDLSLHLPPEMAGPHYNRLVRATEEWADVIPGFQCRLSSPGDQVIYFRLKPAGNAA